MSFARGKEGPDAHARPFGCRARSFALLTAAKDRYLPERLNGVPLGQTRRPCHA